MSRRALLPLAYALCGLLFTYLYFATTREWPEATVERLVSLEAAAPFQQRLLAPLLLRAGVALGLPLAPLYKALVWGSTVGLLVAMRALLQTLGARWPDWSALLVLYPLIWNSCVFGVFRYPSDVLGVALFTVGLWAILAGRTTWLYSTVIVAALNRETAILLVVALVAARWSQRTRPALLGDAIALVMVWGLIRGVIGTVAPGVGGAAFYPQLTRNAQALLTPHVWPAYILSFGGAWLAVGVGWRQLPPVLRRLFVLAPVLVAIIAVVGNLHEARVYGELVPLVAATLAWKVPDEQPST